MCDVQDVRHHQMSELSLETVGAVTSTNEELRRAKSAILAHDPKVHDIVEMLLGEENE